MEDETQVIPPAELPDAEAEAEAWPSANGDGPPASVIEAVRARRQALAAEHVLDFDLPAMQGLLALRLAPIPSPQLARIGRRVEGSKSPERDYNGNADILIAACSQVLARAKPEDEWTPLPGPAGMPCRIDEALAGHLGLPAVTTARELVRELFRGAPAPEFAVGYAANEYVQWAAAANADVDEELLGES
jgi:hypothetical protein